MEVGNFKYSFFFIELPVDITMSDINPNMLEVGKRRAVERGIFHGRSFWRVILLFRSEVLGR